MWKRSIRRDILLRKEHCKPITPDRNNYDHFMCRIQVTGDPCHDLQARESIGPSLEDCCISGQTQDRGCGNYIPEASTVD